MFIVGGTNAYPAEIERIIGELSAVAQAHVVGIPDERHGEVGAAFVQRRDGATLNAQTVIEHCRARLAGYKVPRHVRFVGDFPMTATGKIRKYRLRETAIDERGLADLARRRLLDYGRGG